jgi:hypothetical protein
MRFFSGICGKNRVLDRQHFFGQRFRTLGSIIANRTTLEAIENIANSLWIPSTVFV